MGDMSQERRGCVTGIWLADNQSRDLNNELWLAVYLLCETCPRRDDAGLPRELADLNSSLCSVKSGTELLISDFVRPRFEWSERLHNLNKRPNL